MPINNTYLPELTKDKVEKYTGKKMISWQDGYGFDGYEVFFEDGTSALITAEDIYYMRFPSFQQKLCDPQVSSQTSRIFHEIESKISSSNFRKVYWYRYLKSKYVAT